MGKPAHPIVYLEKRKEVAEAYASHEKLRCIFSPKDPIPLETGLQMTAEYVQKHYYQGGFEPTGASPVIPNCPAPLAPELSAHTPCIGASRIQSYRGGLQPPSELETVPFPVSQEKFVVASRSTQSEGSIVAGRQFGSGARASNARGDVYRCAGT